MSGNPERPKIVVLDGQTLNPGDNPWDALQALGQLDVHPRSAPDQLLDRSQGAQVLVINKAPVTDELMGQLPDLQFVAVTATGYDCVDVQAARSRGITVSNVPEYGTASVAQLTFAHILQLCHRIDLHDQAVRQGEWNRCGDFRFWKIPLTELADKALGIIGFGRIGRQVAYIASALGMQILAHNPSVAEHPFLPHFSWVGLEPLLERSDIVTLHCPATPQTVGLVNARRLQLMKSSAWLINVSRGSLVVEQDLAEALRNGTIAGAGLDVVEQEPIAGDSPLLDAPNCFITPHLAWATLEARQRLMRCTVDNIQAFLEGRAQNVVAQTGPRE